MRTISRVATSAAALVVLITSAVSAQVGTAVVNGQANPWYAGLGSPTGDGLLPFSIGLTAGTGRVATFSNGSGMVSCCSSTPFIPIDGDASFGQSLASVGGISGINLPTHLGLVGVFLSSSGQPGSAPAALDFTAGSGIDFPSVAPVLGQTFFIGDGFTSGSVQQQFFVPNGADELYLGIPDACGFSGTPTGCYSDNSGDFTIDYTVTGNASTSATPEPATLALLATGLVGIVAVRRRRR